MNLYGVGTKNFSGTPGTGSRFSPPRILVGAGKDPAVAASTVRVVP